MRLEILGLDPLSFDEAVCGFVARSSVLERLRSRGAIGPGRYCRELDELMSSFRRSAKAFDAERLPVFGRLMAGAKGVA